MEPLINDNYRLSITLSEYYGSFIREMELDTGEVEECICIPMKRNAILKTKKGKAVIRLIMRRYKNQFDKNRTHYLKVVAPKELVETLGRAGYHLPYIGGVWRDESVNKFNKAKTNRINTFGGDGKV